MFNRNLVSLINTALADSPAILLNGARQVGKSTLAKALLDKDKSHYLSLDDDNLRAAALADPKSFISHDDKLLVIDEIQRAPELMLAIKLAIDQNRQPGRFLLTGSANVLLLPSVSESLAGRIEIHTLWPLSQGELQSCKEQFIDVLFDAKPFPIHQEFIMSPSELNAMIVRGGYPEIIQRQAYERRQAWFRSYITTVIHREIRDIANIEGLHDLPRLLQLLAIRSGTLLNYAELSRVSGLPQTTLKRYLSLFEAIFLYHVLPPWTQNLNKRLVKSPKVFLNDTGLIAHLQGVSEQQLNNDRNLLGNLLESFVFLELKKQSGWSQIKPYFFHYRAHTGGEIDLLLEEPAGRLVGIEVKAAATVSANDFKNLKQFADEMGDKFWRGIVLYTGTRILPFGTNMFAVPVKALWELACE